MRAWAGEALGGVSRGTCDANMWASMANMWANMANMWAGKALSLLSLLSDYKDFTDRHTVPTALTICPRSSEDEQS